MSVKGLSDNRRLGRFIGYKLAGYLSKDSEPVYILGVRIHHYILLFFSIFLDDEFQKGVLEGASWKIFPIY